MKRSKFETIEGKLQNLSPWVYAKVGSSIVDLDGEFDLEEIRGIYEWMKRNDSNKC